MNGISILFLLGTLWFLWQGASAIYGRRELKRLRDEDIQMYKDSIERTPGNAGAHAQLAEKYIEDNNLDAGIYHYRTAINLLPHGPFTTKWKRQLKHALEWQQIVEDCRAKGRKLPLYADWRVCHECDATVSVHDKTCRSCGTTLNMSMMEWGTSPEVQREIWRTALPIAAVLWVCFLIFSALPLEFKGVILVATAIMGGFYLIRSMNGDLG